MQKVLRICPNKRQDNIFGLQIPEIFLTKAQAAILDSICNTGLGTNSFIPVVQTKKSYKSFPKYKF